MIPNSGGRINYLKAAIGLLKTPKYSPMQLITENKGVVGFNLSFLFTEQEMMKENLAGLLEALNSGKLKAPSVTEFADEDVAKAHAFIESGKSIGKLVLRF